MNKRLLIVVLTVAFLFTLTGCKPSKEITYNTNEDFYTNERIDWYTSEDWGGAIDGSEIRVGEFDIAGNQIQLLDSKAAPASFDQIFFNKSGYMSDYRLSADFTINSMPELDGTFNKVGFYAAYQDEQNFVWVIMHPLESEQFLSVTTMVNGSWEHIWKVIPLPDGISTEQSNNIEVVKIGSEFRLYFNDAIVGSFEADILEAQFGFLSEEITYTASNIVFDEATEFESSTVGWGDSADEAILESGNYDVVMNDIVLDGDSEVSSIFRQNESINDFVIQAFLEYETLADDSYLGFYTSYEDSQNFINITYTPDNNSINVDVVEAGISNVTSVNIDHIDVTNQLKLQVFKLAEVGKVYVNDTLVSEYSAPNADTTYGLNSQNADVKYNGFSVSEITAFPVEDWGGSFDGIIPQRGLYEVVDGNVTILTTAGGAYGEFETVFYKGNDAQVDFAVSADMYIPDTLEVSSTTKYGFLLYNSPEYYLEIFIIPSSNQIYTVGKATGEFMWADEGFWHSAYTFPAETVFTDAVDLRVEKVGGIFTVFVNDEAAFTLDLPGFAELEMQIGLTAENTAPVHFDDFLYESVSEADKGPIITDLDLETSFESGTTAPDFTTYITATDNVDGNITITTEMIDISAVDMDTVGTFDVVYTVTDSDLNVTTHAITFNITAPAQVYWGGSYDDAIISNGLFTSDESSVTIVATNGGGYGDMEQVFYNGVDPQINFVATVNARIDSSVAVDVNTKYGLMLYNSPTNYLEIFVIPDLNGIYTVSQVDGNFVKLWTEEYVFLEGHDFTVDSAFSVEKIDDTINVYIEGTLIFSVVQPEYELLEMQVALIGEKTAPIYFTGFTYGDVIEDANAPTFDAIIDQTIEAGITDIDFTTLIMNAVDDSTGPLTFNEVEDNVLYDTLGVYTVTVSVSDKFGNLAEQTFNVTVEDTTAPTFDTIADQEIPYTSSDIDFSSLILNQADNAVGTLVVSETVDNVVYGTPGEYTVTVRLTDASGNLTEQTFNVTVLSDPAPIITLVGLDTSIGVGSVAPDFTTFITAYDAEDGDITIISSMVDETAVDMNTIGTFDVEYTVTDTDLYSTSVTITFTIYDVWGDSHDGLVLSNDQYSVFGNNVTIANSLGGGYGSLEQVYYNGSSHLAQFISSTDISIDDSVVVDVNTKYGMMLYSSPTNYLEIFVIPELNGIFTVSQVDGNFVKLWTEEYVFEAGFDFTEAHNLTVEKYQEYIYVYVDGVYAFTVVQAEYSLLDMQVALIGEKTAPIYFDNFSYLPLVADSTAPSFDAILDQTIEAGVSDIDFTTLITNAVDTEPGHLFFTENDTVIYNTVGTYTVSVTVSDRFGNETEQSFDVMVEDTTAPTFDTILDVEIPIDSTDIDFGTYITNPVDNSVGTLVPSEVEDNVLYDTAGTYTVTVKLADGYGNEGTQTFNVTVIADPSPIITVVGLETLFELDSAAPDLTQYITAIDAVDGVITITAGMIDDTLLDMNTIGTFDIVFTVSDSDLYTDTVTITFTIQDAWGDSYDGVVLSNDQYTVTGNDVTISSTLNGGYGTMEQVYYNLDGPYTNFEFDVDVHMDSSVVVTGDTKYGFILYNSPTNYVEIYIIPSLDGFYTVAQVDGVWDRLWTPEYSFAGGIDFTTANNYQVVKDGGTFSVYVDSVLAFTYTNAVYETLAMQVGFIGEKTAPVYFNDFSIQDSWGDSYDGLLLSNDQYSVLDNDVTITNTLNGGYGAMEQVFYNGVTPLVDSIVSVDIHMDSSVVVTADTKYGFIFYYDATNYVEIYIIPDSDGIYTVSQAGGVWDRLWTLEYSFAGGIDFTTANNYQVVKDGATFSVYVDSVLAFTYTNAAFETLAMQVGFIGEKTAPIYFTDFKYESYLAE